MYQNRRGITGLRCLREARNCTTQRPPNISAPVRPLSFHGDRRTPAHSSDPMAVFMKSVAGIIGGLRRAWVGSSLAERVIPMRSRKLPHDVGTDQAEDMGRAWGRE